MSIKREKKYKSSKKVEEEQENKTIYENAQTIKTLLLNIANDYEIIEIKSRLIENNRQSLTNNLLPLHQEAIRKVEAAKKELLRILGKAGGN